MNDNIRDAQVTIQQMKRLITALDDLGQRLPNNPKLFAFMAEAPIDDLMRMVHELDACLEVLKHVTPTSASPTSIVENPIPNSAAPGPIESTS